MSDSVREALDQGLDRLGLSAYAEQIWQYLQLLKRWNRSFNLVAKADDHTFLNRHIFDSLAVRRFIKGTRCLDVGTGAGLPGLLLAVTMPAEEWTLLDANGKKTRFCEQAVHEMGLKNVTVVQQRIEHHQPRNCYDTIVSRAYDQAADFIESTRHLLCVDGQILAMKGRIDAQEKTKAEATGLHLEIESLQIPGLVGQRHLMKLSN